MGAMLFCVSRRIISDIDSRKNWILNHEFISFHGDDDDNGNGKSDGGDNDDNDNQRQHRTVVNIKLALAFGYNMFNKNTTQSIGLTFIQGDMYVFSFLGPRIGNTWR